MSACCSGKARRTPLLWTESRKPACWNIAYYLCVILTFLCVIAGSLGLMLLFKELIID